MKMFGKKVFAWFAAALAVLLAAFPINVFAASADIILDVDSASVEKNSTVTVKVNIEADEQIGTYYFELEYDDDRLVYVSGAEESKDNVLILKGTGMEDTVTYSIDFTSKSSGIAGVYVKKAIVNGSEADGAVSFDVESKELLQIVVQGQSDGKASFEEKIKNEEILSNIEMAVSGVIYDEDNNAYYVIDLNSEIPEQICFEYMLAECKIGEDVITSVTDADATVQIIALAGADGNITLKAVAGGKMYPVEEYTDPSGNKYLYTTFRACSPVNKEIAESADLQKYVVYAIPQKGAGDYCYIAQSGTVNEWVRPSQSGIDQIGDILTDKTDVIPWEKYLIYAAAIIVAAIILTTVLAIVFSVQKKKNPSSDDIDENAEDDDTIQIIDDEDEDFSAFDDSAKDTRVIGTINPAPGRNDYIIASRSPEVFEWQVNNKVETAEMQIAEKVEKIGPSILPETEEDVKTIRPSRLPQALREADKKAQDDSKGAESDNADNVSDDYTKIIMPQDEKKPENCEEAEVSPKSEVSNAVLEKTKEETLENLQEAVSENSQEAVLEKPHEEVQGKPEIEVSEIEDIEASRIIYMPKYDEDTAGIELFDIGSIERIGGTPQQGDADKGDAENEQDN